MVAELWQRVLPVLLEALSAEMDLSTIITKIECLRECLEVTVNFFFYGFFLFISSLSLRCWGKAL